MMESWEFLSGNVPGGLGLYFFVILSILAALYFISRRNELFTLRHALIWFGGISLLLTFMYVLLWQKHPPSTAFSRYSTRFFSARPEDHWLAYYFRDALSKHIRPIHPNKTLFFLQRWHYLIKVDCAEEGNSACEKILPKIPITELITGEILPQDSLNYILLLSINDVSTQKILYQSTFSFSEKTPEKVLPEILAWLKPYYKIEPLSAAQTSPVQRELVLARDLFYRKDYQKSQERCIQLQKQYPESQEIRQWRYYNAIRIAATLRNQASDAPSAKSQETTWQSMNKEANAFLVDIAKVHLDKGINDNQLFNMVAESFILEERYQDAENFLKIAYHSNPSDITTLKNLSLLSPTRYQETPFKKENDILEKILFICPLYETVLKKYVENTLESQVLQDQSLTNAKAFIEHAIRINPLSTQLLTLEGKYYNAVSDYEKGLEVFQKIHALDPTNGMVKYNLGVTFFNLKKLKKAEQHFKAAIQLNNYPDAHLYLGVIYKNRGHYNKALQYFRSRVALKKNEKDYYAIQAMKGIRECLDSLNITIPR